MSTITQFNYEGNDISFEFEDGNKMINATEMARRFDGKYVADFLRLKRTKEYITLLEKRYGNSHIAPKRSVLRVVRGGDASEGLQGTWMDEKLALKFASWLSPEFELWVFDRIYELLLTGKTEIKEHRPADGVIKSIRLIADQLETQGQEIGTIKDDLQQVKAYVSDLEAKITSIDEHYYSVSGYCALQHVECPLDKARAWGYQATKLSREQNVDIGKAYDAKYGNINTYHRDILAQVIN
jgi:hypothetical protein